MANINNNINSNKHKFPTYAAGSLIAGPILSQLFPQAFGGQTDFNMTNPAKYMSDLVLSNADIANIQNQGYAAIDQKTAGIREDIKSAGAATGNEAATQTALANVATNVAKGTSGFKSDLALKKKQSFTDYFNLLQNYESAKMAHEQGNANASASITQTGLGGLSKLLTLWQGGLI